MNYMRVAQSLVRINCNTYTTAENIDTLQIAGTFLKMSGKLHIYYPQPGDLELEAMTEKIKEIVQKTGCKLLVFDNLLFMARGKDVSEKVGEITRAFKMLAETLGISIILITHPRKTNHNKALTPDDLKDSSSIFQDLDVLILMHRAQVEAEIDEASLNDDSDDIEFDGDIFDPLTEIRVISRYSKGGKTYLNFNGNRGIFKDFGDGFKKSMNKKKEEELKRRKRKESRDGRNK
jgi:replicative DNA helicase